MEKDKLIYDRLNINIFTIGYTPEGESIVFIIWSGKNILYTGVIDSFEKDGINQTRKLLDDLGINKINMLCWSHPDEDHSKGFRQLFDLLDKNSVFVIPNNVVSYKDKITLNFNEIWDFISNEELKPSEQRKIGYTPVKCEIQYISDSADVLNLPCEYFVNGAIKYEFSLKSFLPKSSDTYKGVFNKNNLETNGFSVGLMLQLGTFCAVFASDCHDNYIEKIYKQKFTDYCDFLKIPHHGSKTSTKIIDHFNESLQRGYKIKVASVTKKTIRLPASEAIEKYKKVCDNIMYTNEKVNGVNYGISVVFIDVTDFDCQYVYNFFGNAGLIK